MIGMMCFEKGLKFWNFCKIYLKSGKNVQVLTQTPWRDLSKPDDEGAGKDGKISDASCRKYEFSFMEEKDVL